MLRGSREGKSYTSGFDHNDSNLSEISDHDSGSSNEESYKSDDNKA